MLQHCSTSHRSPTLLLQWIRHEEAYGDFVGSEKGYESYHPIIYLCNGFKLGSLRLSTHTDALAGVISNPPPGLQSRKQPGAYTDTILQSSSAAWLQHLKGKGNCRMKTHSSVVYTARSPWTGLFYTAETQARLWRARTWLLLSCCETTPVGVSRLTHWVPTPQSESRFAFGLAQYPQHCEHTHCIHNV